jgi:hypothetical protein
MGETRARLEQNIQRWNAHDSAAWIGDFSPAARIVGPGASGSGIDMAGTFYSIWQDAFPDNEVRVTDFFEDGVTAILQAEFRGTQTEVMNAPEQTIPGPEGGSTSPSSRSTGSTMGGSHDYALFRPCRAAGGARPSPSPS